MKINEILACMVFCCYVTVSSSVKENYYVSVIVDEQKNFDDMADLTKEGIRLTKAVLLQRDSLRLERDSLVGVIKQMKEINESKAN